MKKTYIIPQTKLAATSFNPLMHEASISYKGKASEYDVVDSKRRYIDDCETNVNNSSGFYTGWE